MIKMKGKKVEYSDKVKEIMAEASAYASRKRELKKEEAEAEAEKAEQLKEEYAENRRKQSAFLDPMVMMARSKGKIGRNEPCPCGSKKKYKKCCFSK